MATANITDLLNRSRLGDKNAESQLLTEVYAELHRIASGYFHRERRDHTLQATALINEAYIKLISQPEIDWKSRTHFFSLAARQMRRILVDYARQHRTVKRGGGVPPVRLDDVLLISDQQCEEFPELDAALEKLKTIRPQWANVVEMRYFGGMTELEIAEALGVSERTVKRHWEHAQAWLYDELSRE